jgi:hypothetical protein
MMSERKRIAFLSLLFLTPMAALANGVSPILNLFNEDTWLPASIVTLAIILIESGLLRWRIKGFGFGAMLWRVTLLNLASSATGSILLLAVSRDFYFMWDTTALVFPLFLITLVTEIPILKKVFKTLSLSWERAIYLGVGMNIASYMAVFVLQIIFLIGWLSYVEHLDSKETRDWSHLDRLKQESGLIYATESLGQNHYLRVFDPQDPRWLALTNGPSLDPNKWDVEGDTLAFVEWPPGDWREDWSNRRVLVCRLPGFQMLHEFSPSQFADLSLDTGSSVSDLAVSPDRKSLALLVRYADAVAHKNASSHYNLGGKCKLIVMDLVSGQEISRATRWASDSGLCWLPDARRVLFSSFDDESLFETTRAEVRGDIGFGLGYGGDRGEKRFQRGLYVFDIDAKATVRFADGYGPSLAVTSGTVLARYRNSFFILDSLGTTQHTFEVARVAYRRAVVSPSGDTILTEIERHSPYPRGGRLVAFHRDAPEVRTMVDPKFSYRVDWTQPSILSTNQGLPATQ